LGHKLGQAFLKQIAIRIPFRCFKVAIDLGLPNVGATNNNFKLSLRIAINKSLLALQHPLLLKNKDRDKAVELYYKTTPVLLLLVMRRKSIPKKLSVNNREVLEELRGIIHSSSHNTLIRLVQRTALVLNNHQHQLKQYVLQPVRQVRWLTTQKQ
jgi:hypothetical protein